MKGGAPPPAKLLSCLASLHTCRGAGACTHPIVQGDRHWQALPLSFSNFGGCFGRGRSFGRMGVMLRAIVAAQASIPYVYHAVLLSCRHTCFAKLLLQLGTGLLRLMRVSGNALSLQPLTRCTAWWSALGSPCDRPSFSQVSCCGRVDDAPLRVYARQQHACASVVLQALRCTWCCSALLSDRRARSCPRAGVRPCLGDGCPCGALRRSAAHRAPAAGVPIPRAVRAPAPGGMHDSQVCRRLPGVK